MLNAYAHVVHLSRTLSFLGSACRTSVAKVLAKTFNTPHDAEAHFYSIVGAGILRAEAPVKALDNGMQEQEPPEGATLHMYTYTLTILFMPINCRLFNFDGCTS